MLPLVPAGEDINSGSEGEPGTDQLKTVVFSYSVEWALRRHHAWVPLRDRQNQA